MKISPLLFPVQPHGGGPRPSNRRKLPNKLDVFFCRSNYQVLPSQGMLRRGRASVGGRIGLEKMNFRTWRQHGRSTAHLAFASRRTACPQFSSASTAFAAASNPARHQKDKTGHFRGRQSTYLLAAVGPVSPLKPQFSVVAFPFVHVQREP